MKTLVEFNTETGIINYFRRMIHDLKERNLFDLVPHFVMAHGYMEWYMLLDETFPSLSQKGPSEKEFQHFCDQLFCDNMLSINEQTLLRRKGWEAYQNH